MNSAATAKAVAPVTVIPLARAPRASHSRGLSLPSAHEDLRVHFLKAASLQSRLRLRVCLARFVAASGFGYPLAAFLPAGPCRPCFVPAALVGFAPSELSPLPEVTRLFRDACTRIPFFRRVSPHRRIGAAGLRRVRFPGFDPPAESLAIGRWFRAPVAGCSPRVFAFQGKPAKDLDPDFAESPPSRFADASPLPATHACASEYRSALCLVPSAPGRKRQR